MGMHDSFNISNFYANDVLVVDLDKDEIMNREVVTTSVREERETETERQRDRDRQRETERERQK